MRDFYEDYYRLTAQSSAHAEFCERVFGHNLCQHGFADMAQLDEEGLHKRYLYHVQLSDAPDA